MKNLSLKLHIGNRTRRFMQVIYNFRVHTFDIKGILCNYRVLCITQSYTHFNDTLGTHCCLSHCNNVYPNKPATQKYNTLLLLLCSLLQASLHNNDNSVRTTGQSLYVRSFGVATTSTRSEELSRKMIAD
jgi:hypothetical protein